MISKELLCRYLDGQCTEQEIGRVQKYLAEDPQATEALEEVLNDAWEKVQDHTIQRDETEKHLQKLQATLYPQQEAKIKTLPIKRWMMYAAAVLVAASMVTMYMWPRPIATPVAIAQVKWDTLINQTTGTQRHQLPDHSVAWLSPGSQLCYSMSTADKRIVKLEGEAFFDVAHEPQRPFTVQTGRMITRVLGTAFNIEAYGKENTMRVSLLRGKVAVQQETPGAAEHTTLETLLPGEMVTYSKSNSTVHKEPLQVKEMEQWTSGNLVLNDVLLTDALERIAARHHLVITTSGPIRKSSKRVSTVFKKETPQQMMEILGFITGSRYRSHTNGTIEVF